MKRIALGFADRAMATELSAILAEIEQVEVVGVLTSSAELVDHCLRQETDIVLIHDGLGPDSATSVIRDLSFRRPGMASLIVSSTGETQTVVDTMEAGGRGVLTYPFVFEQILSRIANASAWVDQMGAVLAGRAAGAGVRRGKVVAFAGAKGGVGATTFAAHLAVDLHQEWPTAKTILVDLDLEKGDVSAMLDVRHTVSIADVAKIAGDMTIDRIQDATVVHDSGLTMLLAPQDVREVDFISPEALRSVFNHLRREYDVIIVDAGAHATPAQATVVELADEVIAVVTADVLCLRSLHRLTTAWESLGVRKERDVRVLVNKVDKSDLFPSSAVPKLTRAPVFTTEVPQMARYLEPAVTNRDPRAVTEKQWWTLIREIGRQVTTGPDAPLPATAAGADAGRGARRRSARAKAHAEAGQVVLENIAIVPLALLFCLIAWQLVLTGMTFMYMGHAADEGARAAAIGKPASVVTREATEALPASMRSGATVTRPSPSSVQVSLPVPLVVPGWVSVSRITTEQKVVVEP